VAGFALLGLLGLLAMQWTDAAHQSD
jgi:hypothetical protein